MADSTPATKPAMSDRELQILATAWQCLKTDPAVDLDRLAEYGGFKNKASAGACLRPVLKKMKELYGLAPALADGDGPGTTAAKTAAARKKKTAAPKKTAVKRKAVSGKTPKPAPAKFRQGPSSKAHASLTNDSDDSNISVEFDDDGHSESEYPHVLGQSQANPIKREVRAAKRQRTDFPKLKSESESGSGSENKVIENVIVYRAREPTAYVYQVAHTDEEPCDTDEEDYYTQEETDIGEKIDVGDEIAVGEEADMSEEADMGEEIDMGEEADIEDMQVKTGEDLETANHPHSV